MNDLGRILALAGIHSTIKAEQLLAENRTPEEVPQWEVESASDVIRHIVSSHRRSFETATEIYHNYAVTGREKWAGFFNSVVIPIWIDEGLPKVSSPGWGKVEYRFKKEVLKINLNY